ncbi:hypothetical protein BDZ89DRAFT_369567 [Hymenopellis radicata]|nr:hypothetical protein BDZ89DRAFT_369567 [Hymenopellis radicata]
MQAIFECKAATLPFSYRFSVHLFRRALTLTATWNNGRANDTTYWEYHSTRYSHDDDVKSSENQRFRKHLVSSTLTKAQQSPQQSSITKASCPALYFMVKIIDPVAHRCNHCQLACIGHRREPQLQPPPDIARLLATNDPPSASQDAEFRQIVVDGAKHLADIDEAIGQMRQALEGLMDERDALAWKVQNCRLVLNPVH